MIAKLVLLTNVEEKILPNLFTLLLLIVLKFFHHTHLYLDHETKCSDVILKRIVYSIVLDMRS